MFISNDTKDLDYITIDLRYTSLDEIKNGILLDEFNSYSYTNNNIVITDKHNNTFYDIADFQFTDWRWETEGSTPKYVNYKTDNNSSYDIGINFDSIHTDDQVYYDSEGFDFSELFVKVKLNIGYVSISLNTGSLLNLSAAEYRLNKNSLYLNIEVKSISDNFQENLTDLNTNDLLELLNISIKNTTTDTVLLPSDYNLVNSSQLYHYIYLNEDVIMPAVYKVIVQNLNPNSSIITEQNMSFELSAVSLELESDYLNNVVVQPDGSITAQFYLYANKGTSYPTNVFESNNDTLTAQLLKTSESGQMSTVELNNINVSYEILDNEIQKTAIIITANLSTVSGSYYTAVLHIQASSDNIDYNDIDTEISFAISKYNLTDNDYIKGTDDTIYNGEEGTYHLSYDLSEGESFKFSDIFDMLTVNNMYGSWKLQQRQASGTYEDIDFTTAITKSNLSFKLVFVPEFEEYCKIPYDIDIRLELNINTNV